MGYIKTKAWSHINIVSIRQKVSSGYINFIHKTLLEYVDVVWDTCVQFELNEIEKIQNEAVRIVAGASKLVSIDNLFRGTYWRALSSRRKKHKQIVFLQDAK